MAAKRFVRPTIGRLRALHPQKPRHCEPVRRLAWQSPEVFGQVIAVLLAITLLTACAPAVQEPPETIPAPTIHTTATTQPTETALPPETISWQEPEDEDFVRVLDYLPGAFQELAYATGDNFTGQVIYDFSDAWLRYGTVKKLMQVEEILESQGYALKIWDGFRPTAAQWKLWEICPDPTYVSDPTNGYSSHSRGNTVDVTLVLADGTAVEMPTGFDDFTHYADRDYRDCPQEAAENARFLENLMKEQGFSAYFGEWWHFSDTETYQVAQNFTPIAPRDVTLTEETALFSQTSVESHVLAWLQPAETVTIQAILGDFAQVTARGGWGYILMTP